MFEYIKHHLWKPRAWLNWVIVMVNSSLKMWKLILVSFALALLLIRGHQKFHCQEMWTLLGNVVEVRPFDILEGVFHVTAQSCLDENSGIEAHDMAIAPCLEQVQGISLILVLVQDLLHLAQDADMERLPVHDWCDVSLRHVIVLGWVHGHGIPGWSHLTKASRVAWAHLLGHHSYYTCCLGQHDSCKKVSIANTLLLVLFSIGQHQISCCLYVCIVSSGSTPRSWDLCPLWDRCGSGFPLRWNRACFVEPNTWWAPTVMFTWSP